MIDKFTVGTTLVRPMEVSDFERINELRSDSQIAKGTGLNLVSSEYSVPTFTRELQLSDTYAIVVDEQVQGAIILNEVVGEFGDVDKSRKELSYYLNPALWSRGIMTQTLGELFKRIGETQTETVQAEVFTENVKSTALLHRLGFTQLATLVDPFALKEKVIYELSLQKK